MTETVIDAPTTEPPDAPRGGGGFRPFVPDDANLRELTPGALVLGMALGVLFAASSVYLALKIGLTVSASIPIAVLSITIFRYITRAFGVAPATILQNNMVQTTGSAGESIAAGTVFTLPALLLAMAFVAVLRPSLLNVLLVIGLVSWTQIARVVRAETLSIAERDFVTAARALGGSPARLIAFHVLPNVMPIIVVMAVLGTSGTLLLDAGLSFLSLGVPPPTPSWGRMIEEALIYFRTAPWLIAFPKPFSRKFPRDSASTKTSASIFFIAIELQFCARLRLSLRCQP